MIETLVIYVKRAFAYDEDWLDALTASPELDVTLFPVTPELSQDEVSADLLSRLRRAELIMLMHSTNSQGDRLPPWLYGELVERKGKLAIFFGNEYKEMDAKCDMANRLAADLIISQLPEEAASWMYAPLAPARPLSILHALNPKVFFPTSPTDRRPIDVGYRGSQYPFGLGDFDRNILVFEFTHGPRVAHLKRDIAFDYFDRPGWANFLNDCKATISSEAGLPYLDRTDERRRQADEIAAQAIASGHVNAEQIVADIAALYVGKDGWISGKTLSSRHFEAVGCKTCQIMFPGRFADVFIADVHYLSLARDFSNLDQILARLADPVERENIAEAALQHVLSGHTLAHRVKKIVAVFQGLGGSA
jgi:spore maturation protein CgeB